MSSPASSALGFLVRAMARCEGVLWVWALAGASVSGAAQFSSGGWCWRWKRNGALFWRLGGLLLLVTARPPVEPPKNALLRGLFTTERAQGPPCS